MQRRIVGFVILVVGLLGSLVACGKIAPLASIQGSQLGSQPVAAVKVEVTYYVRVTETRAAANAWATALYSPATTVALPSPTLVPTAEPTTEPTVEPTVEPMAAVAETATPETPKTPEPAANAQPLVVSASDGSIDGVRQEMLGLHNAARAREGLPPLIISPQLQQAAQLQAEWLAQKAKEELWSIGPGAHRGAGGSGFVDRIATTGYPAPRQNVNENYMFADTPQAAMDWWMNDPVGAPTHRPQIMSPLYRDIGIGVVNHSSGAGYVFIITFGAQ